MLKNLNLMEEQESLRICENIEMQKLPESVQQMIGLAHTPEEKDIILMATLAAASACAPNLYFKYCPTGKKYYANLQCFILAAAASGKGIANQALEMVRVIDEQYPMLIAGDSTLPAWYKALDRQGGCGYMHEFGHVQNEYRKGLYTDEVASIGDVSVRIGAKSRIVR